MQDQAGKDELRAAFLEGMSRSAASVSVVTTDGPAGRGGVTVSAMTSISADGEWPTMLTCLNASSSALPLVLENKCFCINVLRTGQTEISDVFSSRMAPRRAATSSTP
jgi:flavin reductase